MQIAIVAMGQSKSAYIDSAGNAGTPYQAWDQVWTLNGLVGVLRADRYFMLDDFDIQQQRAEWHPYIGGMLKTAKASTAPIYTTRALEDYPALIEYPIQQVVDKLQLKRLYFTNSVPYMIALALAEGATRIGIFGCDYIYNGGKNTEKGRACLEYWCGFAEARGVEIYLPKSTTLMEGGVPQYYGYWTEDMLLENQQIVRKPAQNPPTARQVEAIMSHK